MFAANQNRFLSAVVLTSWCALLLLTDAATPMAHAQPNDPNRALMVYVEYTFDVRSGPNQPSQTLLPDQVKDPNMYPWGKDKPTYEPNHPDWPNRSGLWGLSGARKSGALVFDIDNTKINSLKKFVRLEYEALTHGGGVAGPPTVDSPPGSAERPAGQAGDLMPDGAAHYVFTWVIDPQPDKERITIPIRTGAHADDYAYVDNVKIFTKCYPRDWIEDPNDPDFPWYKLQTGQSHVHYFDAPGFPPNAYYEALPDEYDDESWSVGGGLIPQWLPGVTDHIGVMGLPGGFSESTQFGVHLDDEAEPNGVEYVAYQFDFYAAEGGTVTWQPLVPPGCLIENFHEEVDEVGEGWQRVYITFEAVPPPEWLELHWSLTTSGRGGPVVIDNVITSESTKGPGFWFDNIDAYEPGLGLHGSGGWKGWDNNPLGDGLVVEDPARSLYNALSISDASDLVQEFRGFTSGTWALTTWMYVPGDFVSGCDPYDNCGSYLILLNTYDDGGPYHWSVQLHADSVSGAFIRDQQGTVSTPLITDAWVKIDVVIDLDADLYRVYYGGAELGTAASWTAGVYGGGGGALDVAAMDLYANGSSPVYYDDFDLRPVLRGDLNCDGAVGFGDINPFVKRLSAPAAYAEAFPLCADANGDLNANGTVGFDDINPFVALLSGGY